jgi:ABC-type glycerol-3-phosphate transport system substrate-binding protein
MTRLFRFALIALPMVAGLTGCGGGGEPPTAPTVTVTETTPAEASPAMSKEQRKSSAAD